MSKKRNDTTQFGTRTIRLSLKEAGQPERGALATCALKSRASLGRIELMLPRRGNWVLAGAEVHGTELVLKFENRNSINGHHAREQERKREARTRAGGNAHAERGGG